MIAETRKKYKRGVGHNRRRDAIARASREIPGGRRAF